MDQAQFRHLLEQVPSWQELTSFIVKRRDSLMDQLIWREDLTEKQLHQLIGELRGLTLFLATPDYFEQRLRMEKETEDELTSSDEK